MKLKKNIKRTIKFRGKRLKTDDPLERWIEGSLVEYTDIYDHKQVRIVSSSSHYNDVSPETVGQFTGQLDKNGKEIYEDDIVRYYDFIEDEFLAAEVTFHADSCSFCAQPKCNDPVGLFAHWQYEVIGNIHDNPSLISDKQ